MKRFGYALTASLLLATLDAGAQIKVWTTTADFDGGTLTNASDTRFPNEVVLGPTAVSKTHVVWATNYLYGYTVRLDTFTGKQTGRYDSALTAINGVATGAQPAQTYCDFSTTGNCPGRVAVDTNGDVWIVNRAFSQQGTVTKFSGDLSHCIDRNNNGVIDTSIDRNGDGLIDVTATGSAAEYYGQNDECILDTIKVGGVNALPRGVAVDKYGKIWVCTYNEGKLYRFNPLPPVALEATVTVGGNPYSIATGGDYVFASNSTTGTNRVHITNVTQIQTLSACKPTYGVVADPNGQWAYLGGYPNDGLWRADFATNTCTKTATGGQTTATTLDLTGNVWVANYANATVHKINSSGAVVGTYPAGGTNPHGLSVDFQGYVWVVLHGPPSMAKLDPNTGGIVGKYSIAGTGIPNADPYLYSDFTGVQIDRQAPYVTKGTWDGVFDGGRSGIPWAKVSWSATTPSLTSLAVAVRAADTTLDLGKAAYVSTTSGAALSAVSGRYVQVRASLGGPGFVTSELLDLTVTGPCATPGAGCCISDSDCDDSNACTSDVCPTPGGVCTHAPIANCCLVSANCNDGNVCTNDVCPTPGGTCSFAAIPGCCASNADCADADPCTVDLCSGPGGTCSHPLIAGCCNTDADCTAASACTTTSCPVAGGACLTVHKPSCCSTNKDCVDADPCTADTCDPATGVCSNTAIAGCCTGDGQCNDGKPCTKDTCSGSGGVCVFTAIAGCCMTDADCTGSTACAKRTCSGPGGVCTGATQPDCCATAGDCDDGDACTIDACPTPGAACTHTAKASCCRASADCDDGDRCTQDDCPTPGGACAHARLVGCCATQTDCAGDEACTSGWCTKVAPLPDAGPDAADDATADASDGSTDASDDADRTAGSVEGGGACGCRAPGDARTDPSAAAVALLGLGLVGARRRRRAR